MSDDESGRPHLRLISGQAPQNDPPGDGDAPVLPARPPVVPAGAVPYPPGTWAMLHDQTGRTVMLTGYGGGLDIAVATGLADAGARLAVADRDPDRARLIARAASRSATEGSIALGLDPARPEQVRRGIGAVEQLTGRLDGLVVIVEQGRAAASADGEPGVTLGEMIHLVRATERRMAVLGGGRIVVIAGGATRDPAVAAITVGAVTEFVRTLSAGPAAGIVSINAIIAESPPARGATAEPPREPEPPPAVAVPGEAEPAPPAADTPAPDANPSDESTDPDADTEQPPVLPFRFAVRAADPGDGPSSGTPPATPAAPVSPTTTHIPENDLAPVVAAAALFLSPAAAAITGQVLRITIPTVG